MRIAADQRHKVSCGGTGKNRHRGVQDHKQSHTGGARPSALQVAHRRESCPAVARLADATCGVVMRCPDGGRARDAAQPDRYARHAWIGDIGVVDALGLCGGGLFARSGVFRAGCAQTPLPACPRRREASSPDVRRLGAAFSGEPRKSIKRLMTVPPRPDCPPLDLPHRPRRNRKAEWARRLRSARRARCRHGPRRWTG